MKIKTIGNSLAGIVLAGSLGLSGCETGPDTRESDLLTALGTLGQVAANKSAAEGDYNSAQKSSAISQGFYTLGEHASQREAAEVGKSEVNFYVEGGGEKIGRGNLAEKEKSEMDFSDVLKTVDIMLDKSTPTTRYERWIKDINRNGKIDLFDLLEIVDYLRESQLMPYLEVVN